MFNNIGAFFWAVADHWLFWIGIGLMIEPYLEGGWPTTYKALKAHFAKYPKRRQTNFRKAGAIALLIACYQAWNVEYQSRIIELPINDAQRDKLIAAFDVMNPKPLFIAMATTNADQWSERYAYALRTVLHTSGIDVEMGYTLPDSSDERGVIISIRDMGDEPPEATALRAALKKGGVETLLRPFPRNGIHGPSDVADVNLKYILWVGPKP